MRKQVLVALAFGCSLAVPTIALAQGVPGGIVYGASVGNQDAGPVGAVVGGAVGGVVGGVEGVLGIPPRPVEPVPVRTAYVEPVVREPHRVHRIHRVYYAARHRVYTHRIVRRRQRAY